MGGPDRAQLQSVVRPGESIDIAVNFTAPGLPGNYRGDWFLRAPSGEMFGAGPDGTKPFWVKISVFAPAVQFTSTPVPSPTATRVSATASPAPAKTEVYDFVANACNAQWSSGAGALVCPGTKGDPRGFVSVLNTPQFEDGSFASAPGILTNPNYASNGYIQGIFTEYTVQNGDRFQAVVSCEYGASQCGALLHLGYQDQNGFIRDLWAFGEFQDGRYYSADIDLSFFAGQKVKFAISVLSIGPAEDDKIMWVGAGIVRAPATAPTARPTPIPAPPGNSRFRPE